VDPFGFKNSKALPDILPHPLTLDYKGDFLEVKEKGEDNAEEDGRRTEEETTIGIWWAYDGALRVGVPPRLYSQQIDIIIAKEFKMNNPNLKTGFQYAKLLAMVNVAMADSTIAVRSCLRLFFARRQTNKRKAPAPHCTCCGWLHRAVQVAPSACCNSHCALHSAANHVSVLQRTAQDAAGAQGTPAIC
jgi:hypothetical protein